MKKLATATAAALALSACNVTVNDDAANNAAAMDFPDQNMTAESMNMVDPGPIPVEPDGGIGTTPEPVVLPGNGNAPVQVATIPEVVQGRWGLVAADCTSTQGDAKGLLTVTGDTLRFYESRGTLAKVIERSPSRIVADFAFSGEGQEWTRRQVLDAQDDGKTLVRREYGDEAMPGVLKYSRCKN